MTDVPFLDRLGDELERAITPEPPRRRTWGPKAAVAGFAAVLAAGVVWWAVGAGSQEPRPDPVATTAATTTMPATTTTVATLDALPDEWGRVVDLDALTIADWVTVNRVLAVPGGYVATGTVATSPDASRPLVAESADGVTWDELPATGLEGGFVNDVARRADGTLVAVGGSIDPSAAPEARFWRFDGSTWSAGTADTTFPASQANTVVAVGDRLVAGGVGYADAELGGQHPALWVSADGTTWEERRLADSGPAVEADIGALAARDGRVIAGGLWSPVERRSEPAVWTSDDLDEWRFAALPNDSDGFAGLGALTVGGPGFVAVGFEERQGATAGAVWTSPDGLAWQRVPHDPRIFGGENLSHTRLSGVTAGPGGLVAVGSELRGAAGRKVILSSPDGLSWARTDVESPPRLGGIVTAADVAAAGGTVVIVGAELSGGNDAALPAVWVSPPPAGAEVESPVVATLPAPPEDDEVLVSVEPELAAPGSRVLVSIEGPRGEDSVVWLVSPGGDAVEACTAAARGGRQRWCRFVPADLGASTPGQYEIAIDDPAQPAATVALEIAAEGTALTGLDGIYTPFLHPLVQQLSVHNYGEEPLDVSGWAVQSPSGAQRLEFPPGTVVGAGQALIVFQGGPGGGVCRADTALFIYTCNHFEGGVGATAHWTGGAVLVDLAGEVRAEWAPPR